MPEIAIIGGGAAGLAAAIRAAGNETNRVTLLERQNRVGRKLLSTGNGRCNLTNTGPLEGRYHGEDPDFAAAALARWPAEAVLGWFGALGLLTAGEYGGRVYPRSGHAASVLDVLRLGLEKPNLRVLTAAPVERLRRRRDGGFRVEWAGGGMEAHRAVVACGGCAGGRLGGVRDGYALLKELGHSVTALRPALAPLRTAPDYPRAMKGIRVEAGVRLLRGNRTLAFSGGDVLFTDTGLSGTAVFDLAAAAGSAGEKTVSLDLFPELTERELLRELGDRRARWEGLPANQIFTGALQSRVGLMLCRYAGIAGGSGAGALSPEDLGRLARAGKDFRLPVTGTGDFNAAQVTAGGVRTGEFHRETLESRLVPGLYACGEVLDVDGDCGGFNLQWAWASGLTVGDALCC